jgi:methyltransferase
MSLPPYLLLTLLVAQRLGELALSRRNTIALLAMGGTEAGAGHYLLFPLLHGAWIATMAWAIPADMPPQMAPLLLFVVLLAARIWVMVSLGRRWTTRIITIVDQPLVRRGPYRWLRHPNYLVVAGEIAVVPLIYGAWPIAVLFSLLNAMLLSHRIGVEEAALEVAVNARGMTAASGCRSV